MEKKELKIGVHLCKKHKSKNAIETHLYGLGSCQVVGCWKAAEYFEEVVVKNGKQNGKQ